MQAYVRNNRNGSMSAGFIELEGTALVSRGYSSTYRPYSHVTVRSKIVRDWGIIIVTIKWLNLSSS